ncbi:hypothetical protein BC829DRAFT_412134 [Chytridium lagenaria]|nr:hypothetical protein BC829DRAFT_412134 [Chytridium lagenaria]
MGPLEALNKLTYLNTSLPFANRLSDDKLKTILISGCQDDRWKSLVKKESYSGKRWDDLTITVDDIVDHMQLHHPRVIAKSDSSETAAIMHAFNEKFENLTQVVADSQREVVRLRRELKKAPNTRDNLLVHIAENTELPLPFVNMSDELVNRTLNTYIHTLNSVLTSDGDSELSDVDIISLRADIEMIRNGAREPYQRQPYRQGYPPRNNDFNNRSRQGSYNNSDYTRSRQSSAQNDHRNGPFTSDASNAPTMNTAGTQSTRLSTGTTSTGTTAAPPAARRYPAHYYQMFSFDPFSGRPFADLEDPDEVLSRLISSAQLKP